MEILKRIDGSDSDFVIKLYEVFEDEFFVYMVFEFLERGDLVQFFKQRPLFEEEELAPFFMKIILGVKNLHK